MAVFSFLSWQIRLTFLVSFCSLLQRAATFTSSLYTLDSEYSGSNFFDGWDFFTGGDPTGGLVTYYSRSSSQLTGLIKANDKDPVYIGVDYVNTLPFNNATGGGDGAGRPSVRISSKRSWTHGLFIGDFSHAPAGVCGTWPAFWTLGPNWPYTGEIDIMEGVNQNVNNIMSLHTNETCTIVGNSSVMTGTLGNTNCAYYPDYNVGCGVLDTRNTSFGAGFNAAGGGVYAMQWTSEYIRIWQWSRTQIPKDVENNTPDPSSWGLPASELAVGNCSVDQHFQQHKVIFDTTFCGEYAGNPYVWNTTDQYSCAASLGLATCDNYVANYPSVFKEAYWGINYVRVYQLADPQAAPDPATSYIASLQPSTASAIASSTATAVPTPATTPGSYCPQYNFTIISDGSFKYEIACGFDPPGPDIIGVPYYGFQALSLEDCVKGCTYLNLHNGTNKCGGVAHNAAINFCYFKKYMWGKPVLRTGFNEVRLIYYGYPEITDDPRMPASSPSETFVPIVPSPQTYRPSTTKFSSTTKTTASTTSGVSETSGPPIGIPAMGDNVTTTTSGNRPPLGTNETTITVTYNTTTFSTPSSGTSTSPITSSSGTPPTNTPAVMTSTSISSLTRSASGTSTTRVTSSDPASAKDKFYITFDVKSASRLTKRAAKYLAFDQNNQSILVDNQSDAAVFHLDDDGSVMTGNDYIELSGSSTNIQVFKKSTTKPSHPVTVKANSDGSVSIPGADSFCSTPDGALDIISANTSNRPEGCTDVSPQVIVAPGPATITLNNPSRSTTSTVTITTTEIFTTRSTIASSIMSSVSVSSTNLATSSSSVSTNTNNDNSGFRLINSFIYSGCFGVSGAIPGVSPVDDSAFMTAEMCTKSCHDTSAYFAGLYNTTCFCGSNAQIYASLQLYPEGSCNLKCPGDAKETCGGTVGPQGGAPIGKRDGAVILITLYNNTLLLGDPNAIGISSTTTRNGQTSSSGGTSVINSPTPSTTITYTLPPAVSSSASASSSPAPFNSIIYSPTVTFTATVLSTTWVDLCPSTTPITSSIPQPPSPTNPGHFKPFTTLSTTIALPHCGCSSYLDAHGSAIQVPPPTIPMTTTIKSCDLCGPDHGPGSVTLTVPCESEIARMTSSLQQMQSSQMATQPDVPIMTNSVGASAVGAGMMMMVQTVTDNGTVVTFTLEAVGKTMSSSPSPSAAGTGGTVVAAHVTTTTRSLAALGWNGTTGGSGNLTGAAGPSPVWLASATGNRYGNVGTGLVGVGNPAVSSLMKGVAASRYGDPCRTMAWVGIFAVVLVGTTWI